MKYHVLLPENSPVGGGVDYFQWAAVLRAVSAVTSYHWVYRDSLKPWLIADLMILNHQMPRSLASCYDAIVSNLDHLANAYGRTGPSQRSARAIGAQLRNLRIEQVFQSGLHEFIETFLVDNARVGSDIAVQYLE